MLFLALLEVLPTMQRTCVLPRDFASKVPCPHMFLQEANRRFSEQNKVF